MKVFQRRGGVVLGCWEGVEGGEGNKRGRISGEEERFGGGEERVWEREREGEGGFYDRIVDS
jgi:hypothetical protein